MTFLELYNYCEELLYYLKDFGVRIIQFTSQPITIDDTTYPLIAILFGGGVVVFLMIAILKAIV